MVARKAQEDGRPRPSPLRYGTCGGERIRLLHPGLNVNIGGKGAQGGGVEAPADARQHAY